MTHWAMVIDLRRCIGCKACVTACSQANGVEQGLWRHCHEIVEPTPPHRQRFFLTRGCMQCREPPCVPVCPTKATYQRLDGIVAIENDRCVGCGACILACPYDARAILGDRYAFETGAARGASGGRNPDREGTCTKCDFCVPRIEAGLEANFRPGIDSQATPSCVVTCSAGALKFGDIDDPDSEVSALIRDNRAAQMSWELGTVPSVYYIVPK